MLARVAVESKGQPASCRTGVAIHRSFQNGSSNVPHRFATPERLLLFFEEKQDLWREHWAQEFRESHPDAGISSPTAGVDSELIEDHSVSCSSMQSTVKGKRPKAVTYVVRRTQDLMKEVLEQGKGEIAAQPCTNCIRRNKPCWLHVDDMLGECMDCMRGVVGELKVRDCAVSRGITEEQFALRCSRPHAEAAERRQLAAEGQKLRPDCPIIPMRNS
jgi:hypothetical protein